MYLGLHTNPIPSLSLAELGTAQSQFVFIIVGSAPEMKLYDYQNV